MRVALCQVNPRIADVTGNTALILDRFESLSGSADLVVFGELAVPGYPPTDRVSWSHFRESCAAANAEIVAATSRAPGCTVVFGTLLPPDGRQAGRYANGAVVARGGSVIAEARKALLPDYDVYDDARLFAPRSGPPTVVEVAGVKVGIGLCEDLWLVPDAFDFRCYDLDVAKELKEAGAQVLLSVSASPWHRQKLAERAAVVGGAARRTGLPVLYANLVGGNDDLLFDGRSLCWDREGVEVARAKAYEEDALLLEVAEDGAVRPVCEARGDAPDDGSDLDVAAALVMGIRDFCRKCGVSRVLVGLSGGVDSSVTAALAVAALGADKVGGVAMPSAISSEHSVADARALAEALGIRFDILKIQPAVDALAAVISSDTGRSLEGVPYENLQARARGTLLMALSNRDEAMVLATGNKVESATGYCTLYGDTVGGLLPLGDLNKEEVYGVGRATGALFGRQVIPESVFTKAPSAELSPGQVDQDSLPPYPLLDEFVDSYIVGAKAPEEAAPKGLDGPRWARVIERNEFKRRQAAPILRVSAKAFGHGRMMSISGG
jgi:NAD+ synthase (glutamine-hydrolysing)